MVWKQLVLLSFQSPTFGFKLKRLGLDSGGEVARFFFLEKRENTGILGKTDV